MFVFIVFFFDIIGRTIFKDTHTGIISQYDIYLYKNENYETYDWWSEKKNYMNIKYGNENFDNVNMKNLNKIRFGVI